ncbi:Protein ROS1 [Acorus calamus]|uniref:Protein ROS1 n=1 Tax=Acorus calamus TaxID=4465 RepID=A0AAV9FE19_ACOCL|nr:Protein ROS1 [Acorus calamus]
MEGNPLHMDLGAAQGSWISRTPARHQPWIGGGGNTDYPFQETPNVTHPPDLSQFGAVDYRSHWMTDLNHGGPVQATTPSRGSSSGNAGRYGLDSHWTSVSCEDLLAYTAMDAASLYSQINGRLQPVGGNRGGGGGQLLLNGRVALSQMSQYQRVEGFPVRLNPNPLEYDLNALPENKDNDVLLPTMRTTGQENQVAGKEDAEQINLNKTPQQKHPRRRKYMPKVVKEGKKPRSRKVNTEATPKTPKRKYVRRADKTTEAIASGSVLDEATAEGPPRQGRSVKRSINFDSETQGNPHVDGFSIGALSPVRLGQGVEVVLERSPRGFAFDLNSYMTRMIDDYIGSPSANTSSVPQTESRKQQGREKLKDIARQKNVKSDDVNGDIQRQPTTLAEAHFQLMQVNKRKRTEKIYIDLTNETTSNCGSTIINNNIECVWPANHAQSPNQEVQSGGLSNQMNLLSTPKQMDGTKKRRSKAPTRSRNLSSLTFSLDCKQNPLENVIVGEPQACVEALKVVNAKLKTRRRTKKGSQNGGANFLALVPYTDPMEELIKKLALLDINAIENAMVPYVANGTMVPFQPVKKRRPRARVILDDETLRLHKHLMLKASGDGSETMDEEKARWWEKEREIFRRRTDSFIRRMHEIQGDRTFSPWKGSVVDSVVGVFLTQNVSDHLSSSAFMALAARFPLRRQDMTEVPNAEEVSTSAEPQQISIVELDSPTNESLCQGSCSQECMVRQEGEIMEVGDSVVCRISKENGLQSSPENRRDMRVTVMESTSVTEAEDSRSLDGISSQNSVISSQNSSEYPIVIADRMGSSSESNSEVEDLLTGNSGFESSMTSFMDLLQMAGNGNFKGLYANGYRSHTEETSVAAAHQLNLPGDPQRNFSFDLNNIQCGSQSTSMFNAPFMRESANSKDTLNVSYNSYHLHSSMQPGKFDMENVGSFQEISRSLPSAASELTVHNNKGRICGLSAGNTSIATAPYVQQTPQTAPASNLHSLISTGKDAKNEVHPPSHSGLCCERTLAISENNTEPVCPGSQVSRTVNIHQKERESNVHVEGTRKTEYTNLLEGLAQRKDNVPADHTSTLPNHSGKSLEGNSK